MDLIVLPESADIPCLAKTREDAEASVHKYNKKLISKCRETAKRCNAILFVNARYEMENSSLRNTTYAIDRKGDIVGLYFKEHLVPSEVSVMKLDSDYTFEHTEPQVIEIDGLRFGFLVCYDFYFYENFANLARQNLDIIIGCSHQRSDTHDALEIMCRFLAYNTNAYVVRSSISMDECATICGASMVVAPNGDVLSNMKARTGLETIEIDPEKKYLKPAGYGNPDAPHYEYIETGRRPWKYRPAGPAMVRYDSLMPYPRVCAHGGFSSAAPAGTMPSFGAAVAMGADEISFDLYATRDGEIVASHSESLGRISDSFGKVYEHTLDELRTLDLGAKYGEGFAGIGIATFEEILKKFSCQVIMNIHIKTASNSIDESSINKILSLIRKYDCAKHIYFTHPDDIILKQIKSCAPNIGICVELSPEHPHKAVNRAIALNAGKVYLHKSYICRESIDKAHQNGIICIASSDDPGETKQLLDMGIDTVLTNSFGIVSKAVNNFKTTI